MKSALRGSVVVIASSLMLFALLALPSLTAARMSLADSGHVKKWLYDSGVYDKASSEVASHLAFERSSGGIIEITTDDIITAMAEGFPPRIVQTNVETGIDAFFEWFYGKTTSPEFKIDLTQSKDVFAIGLGTILKNKIDALPECAASSSSGSFDAFLASCRPASLDSAVYASDFATDIANSKDFLPETIITGNDVTMQKNGQPLRLGGAYPGVPTYHRWLMWLPLAMAVLVGLFGYIMVIASRSRRIGIRRLAHNFFSVGLVVIVFSFALGPLLDHYDSWSQIILGAPSSISVNIINPLMRQIVGTLNRPTLITGGVYVVVGLLIYGALLVMKPKAETVEPNDDLAFAGPVDLQSAFDNPPVDRTPEPAAPSAQVSVEPTESTPAHSSSQLVYDNHDAAASSTTSDEVHGEPVIQYRRPELPEVRRSVVRDIPPRPPMVQG